MLPGKEDELLAQIAELARKLVEIEGFFFRLCSKCQKSSCPL
jgi:hypothetical protein